MVTEMSPWGPDESVPNPLRLRRALPAPRPAKRTPRPVDQCCVFSQRI
jgi:hypothetical protein